MSKKNLIIIGILVVFSFTIGFFVGDNSAINRINKNISQKVQSVPTNVPAAQTESKKEDKIYNVGDTISIGDKYQLTITKISLTNERNQYSEKKVEKVAVIEYVYKNLNDTDELYISSGNFKIYDEEGNVLETYPAGANKIPQKIAKGKQCTAEMSFGFNKGTKLELNYYDNMFSSKSDGKYILNIQ